MSIRRQTLLWGLVLVAVACPQLPAAAPCSDVEECPDGTTCNAGLCILTPADGEGEAGVGEGEGDPGEGEGDVGEGEGEGEGEVGEGEVGEGEGEGDVGEGEGEGEGEACVDSDGDGRGVGCDLGPDCAEGDPLAFRDWWNVDDDGDGVPFTLTSLCGGDTPARGVAGVRVTVLDCDDTDAAVQTGCANGCARRGFGGREIVFCPDARRRPDINAAGFCTGMDATLRLASIHSSAEDDFIDSTLNALAAGRMWIGLGENGSNDPTGWVDGSAYDFNGFPGGRGGNGAERCVNITGGNWDDDDCFRDFGVLCTTPVPPPP